MVKSIRAGANSCIGDPDVKDAGFQVGEAAVVDLLDFAAEPSS